MQIKITNGKILKNDENFSGNSVIDATEIEKKTLFDLKRKIQKEKTFVVSFDMVQKFNLNNVLKKYYYLHKYCLEHDLFIGEKNIEKVCLAYVKNANEAELNKIKDFFIALYIDDIKEKYNYIYDRTCEELDNIFRSKNLCDFKNDSCIAQRLHKTKNETMGCCYSFYYRKDGFPINTGLCKYLSDKGCKIKSLKCKMFTCKYLRKKGIKFLVKDFVLLNLFLNKKQKRYLETAFFKTQEEIVEKWIEDYPGNNCRI